MLESEHCGPAHLLLPFTAGPRRRSGARRPAPTAAPSIAATPPAPRRGRRQVPAHRWGGTGSPAITRADGARGGHPSGPLAEVGGEERHERGRERRIEAPVCSCSPTGRRRRRQTAVPRFQQQLHGQAGRRGTERGVMGWSLSASACAAPTPVDSSMTSCVTPARTATEQVRNHRATTAP